MDEATITVPADPLENIRWSDVWKIQKIRQVSTKNYCASEAFWANENNVTRHFSLPALRLKSERAREQLAWLSLPPGSRVLDIGAGPGTLAVPLARAGCQVTVVEPSAAMLRVLSDYARAEKAGGIEVIGKKWEDCQVEELGEPFDHVIASYSLSMMNIREAALKMDAVCRGQVSLFWFMTPPLWARVMKDLWPKVHGAEYSYEPTADVLWQALVETGIYASIKVEKVKNAHYYKTIGEAAEDFYDRVSGSSPQHMTVIRQYLKKALTVDSQGYRLRGFAHGATVWWTDRAQKDLNGAPGT